MSIVPSSEVLAFMGFTTPYFTIAAVNNVLLMSYNGGADTTITLTDGTYTGDELAAHMETLLDTAFTITSTVAYSATVYKFTFTAQGANTLAFTLTGSDAAALVGFTADKAAAVSITTDAAVGNDNATISSIQTGVEKWVKSQFDRAFESTSHTNERYSGDGRSTVYLRDYPVTAFQKVAIGKRGVIRIWNTNSGTDASASVSSTSVVLYNDEATTATLAFADYATMVLMIAAINATGSGWYAEITSGTYSTFKTTQLLPAYGLTTIDTARVYLSIPETGETEIDVDETGGILYMDRHTPPGCKNIFISYTGGYAAADMPDDLKMAIKIIIKSIYQKRDEEIFHLTDYSLGELSATMQSHLPMEAMQILNNYRRYRI